MSNDVKQTPRTLVLCFDGTAGQYDSDNTNVVKLFALLRKDREDRQRCYYQAGIGTYYQAGIISPLFSGAAKLMDKGIAWYLDAHVQEGYTFLMNNYRSGDKICLFGFSRGAYTARALAGMLNKVGLLPFDNLQSTTFAYKFYKRTDTVGKQLAANFKKQFCRDVQVEFVGVWDTVQSTGILLSRSLPFTQDNTCIKTFRHALSLDEHRAEFRPNLYHRSAEEEVGMATDGDHPAFIADNDETSGDLTEPATTNVLEAWFAGCHSDVGGGNVDDKVKVSLAQITLRWMIEEIIKSNCGIQFADEALESLGISHTREQGVELVAKTLPVKVSEDPGHSSSSALSTEHSDEEFKDAIAPIFDDLQSRKLWWLLEVVPLPWSWQDHKNQWHDTWGIHLGKGRIIPYKRPIFHHTVKLRMDYGPLKYKPRATYNPDVIYV